MVRSRTSSRGRLHLLGFTRAFAFASVSAVVQPFVGHLLGSRLAETQPAKLAAFELATETESPSPLRLGGLIDGEVRWSIDIPYLDDQFQGVGLACRAQVRREGCPGSALLIQRRTRRPSWTPTWTPLRPHCTSGPMTC